MFFLSLLPVLSSLLLAWPAESSPWRLLRDHHRDEANNAFLQTLEQDPPLATPGQSLLEYSRFLKSRGNPRQAATALRQGIAAMDHVLGRDHPLLLPPLLELARLYQDGGEGDPLPVLQRALHIARKSHGEHSLWLPRILESMVDPILSGAPGTPGERLLQAIPRQEQAVALLESALGSDTPMLPPVLTKLGELQQRAGQKELALQNLERALAISVNRKGPDHALRLRLLQRLGSHYLENSRPHQALTYLLPALAVAEDMRDVEHLTLVPLLNQLALCYREMGQPGEATPFLSRALTLTEKRLGTLHPGTARLVATMAGNLRLEGNTAHAIVLYRQAMAVLEQQSDTLPRDMASLQVALARAMVDEGMTIPAEALYRRGLVTLVQELGTKSRDVVKEQQAYAALLQRMDYLADIREMLSDRELLGEIQLRLALLGLDPGAADGKPGAKTKSAIKAFQHRMGLPLSVAITRNNLRHLLQFLPPPPREGCAE